MQFLRDCLLAEGFVKLDDPIFFGQKLGEVFEKKRLEKKLSRNRLSEIARVSRTGIIMFERGERMPSIHILKAMANGMGVKLSQLIRSAEKATESDTEA